MLTDDFGPRTPAGTEIEIGNGVTAYDAIKLCAGGHAEVVR
jgi:hypothetical protein